MPRHDTGTHTERMPQRGRLPAFNPPAPFAGDGPTTWLVVLPTGARVPVDGALLVGRNPVRFDPWTSAALLPVDDPARSVSKTHAVFEASGEGLRITDLHSTNGVSVLDPAGATTVLAPGASASVAPGATVLLGGYRLQVAAA